jgi:hypothetical protein
MGPARLLGQRPDRRLPPPRRDQARPRRDGRIPRRLRALPCVGVVKGEHKFLLYCQYCGYVADVSPQEQWDNIPVIGKLQIFTFVGMLESYGEILGDVPHYTCTTRLRATARRSSSTPTQAVRPRVADIITLADIAYLPLMRCRQLLTWFVTARQPARVLLCAWT